MAIQFLCPSCNQPIEVDEVWAQKTVACPYCRGTVTAPDRSTLPPPRNLPIASPVEWSSSRMPVAPSTNPLALVAFGLAALMAGMLSVSTYLVATHSLELEEITKEIQKRGVDPASQFSAWMDYASTNNGNIPTWFITAGLFQLGGLTICVAAFICGLLALRHPARRGLAAASVIACSAVLALAILSVFQAIG